MRVCLTLVILAQAVVRVQAASTQVDAITDYTNYNTGDVVEVRLHPAAQATISVRYAGEKKPLAANIPVSGSDYTKVWKIPGGARTGRYEVDVTTNSGKTSPGATSFAVHRQLAKVMSIDLGKTFYTSGDSVNPTITIRNVSDEPLDNLQVEFEPYTYPWIAPDPDEAPMWKHVLDSSLSLAPGAQKEFRVQKAAVVQAEKEPVAIYYSVVVRDSRNPDQHL